MNTPVLGNPHGELDFRSLFRIVQNEAHAINVQNGWWEDRDRLMEVCRDARTHVVIAALGLVTSEVAEAMEAVRKHDPSTWSDSSSKDTLVRELAGTIVRCMDLAEHFDLPLAEAIIDELLANKTRGYRHGGKVA